jgi:hypothetical protein
MKDATPSLGAYLASHTAPVEAPAEDVEDTEAPAESDVPAAASADWRTRDRPPGGDEAPSSAFVPVTSGGPPDWHPPDKAQEPEPGDVVELFGDGRAFLVVSDDQSPRYWIVRREGSHDHLLEVLPTLAAARRRAQALREAGKL